MRTGTKLAMDAKDVYSKRILISGYKFNLINTPGLDDPEQSNLEVFKKISTHLLKLVYHLALPRTDWLTIYIIEIPMLELPELYISIAPAILPKVEH